ncbi:MAG: ATP-binding protein [Muribaculaceae bacterium]|nr:ATP-binding protein [Muribaculaceae bacterium]
MTIDDIKGLIEADELKTLELKKGTGELKDGMHAACVFLNTDGGWLIFGVTPKSLKIIGQEVTDSTKREISQALAGIEPAYDIQPIYVDVPEYPGNKVISTNIYSCDNFQLRLARFLGNNKLEFIDNQRVEGNFFDLRCIIRNGRKPPVSYTYYLDQR